MKLEFNSVLAARARTAGCVLKCQVATRVAVLPTSRATTATRKSTCANQVLVFTAEHAVPCLVDFNATVRQTFPVPYARQK